jgi:ribosomal protein L15
MSLNVGQLDAFVPFLEAAGALVRDGEEMVVDLARAGVDRLLGAGTPTQKWRVYVAHASKHAAEKVTLLKEPPEGSKGGGKGTPPERAAASP